MAEHARVHEPRFRADLYHGAAADYEQFRPAYPPALMRNLLRRGQIEAGGRLLDLACGTGQITFALAHLFDGVWAVDQEPGFVEFARAKAERTRVPHVRRIVERAEDLDVGDTRFDLVAIGNAFHRLRRRAVAALAYRWLNPGGCIALLWVGSPWDGQAEWQRELDALMQRWIARVGAADRVPIGLDMAIEQRPHTALLSDAGFELLGRSEFTTAYAWTVEQLAGLAFSTSVMSREVLGPRAPEFVAELRDTLLALELTNRFEQRLSFAYDLARRPATA